MKIESSSSINTQRYQVTPTATETTTPSEPTATTQSAQDQAEFSAPLGASNSVTTADVVSKAQAASAATVEPKLDGLTEEEIGFVKNKLLPTNYSDLKACLNEKGPDAAKALAREGKTGPFAESWGDPEAMLNCARRIDKSPELTRLVKDLKKGDIIVEDWNYHDNPVSTMTKGPYVHAVICTSDGPPPDFVEAFGMAGTSNAGGVSGVRRTPLSANAYDSMSLRLIRPTEGLSEPAKSQAIDKAVNYAEAQLGKPYDYAFTNEDNGKAFYCSELAYLAYADPAGADMKLEVKKSISRDKMIVALNDIVSSLNPDDKGGMMNKIFDFVAQSPPPTADELTAMIVDDILPNCKLTDDICKDDASRDKLKSTIKEIMTGEAFSQFNKAQEEMQTTEENGGFKGILGTFKKAKAYASTAEAFTSDCVNLVKNSGINVGEGLNTVKTLVNAILPHSETLSGFLFGADDSKTKSVSNLLDKLDWIKDKKVPVVSSSLPGRAGEKVEADFVSPTDLAASDLPHTDYCTPESQELEPAE